MNIHGYSCFILFQKIHDAILHSWIFQLKDWTLSKKKCILNQFHLHLNKIIFKYSF